MGRYETAFQLVLTPEQQTHLIDNGRPRDDRQLYVRVADNSVIARWPTRNSLSDPPTFIGEVQRGPTGTMLTGVAREARASEIWARVWPYPMCLMLAVAVLGAADLAINGSGDGLGALLFGAVGASLFALMWWWQTRLRRPSFDSDVRKLTAGLTQYVTTGDGRRPF